MYRRITPRDRQQLPLRMLFQPVGDGSFHRACEADGFRGLVAAILDDPAYETARVEGRLMARLRLADDVKLLCEVEGRVVEVADHDGRDVLNIASDEPFIRSLQRLGYVSLAPRLSAGQGQPEN